MFAVLATAAPEFALTWDSLGLQLTGEEVIAALAAIIALSLILTGVITGFFIAKRFIRQLQTPAGPGPKFWATQASWWRYEQRERRRRAGHPDGIE